MNLNLSCTPTTPATPAASPSKVRVCRGILYCCVPLCHSWKGKVVRGKPATLHRLPHDLKLRRQWIRKLRTVRKNIKPKAGTRVCSLHFKGTDGPKPWCKVPTLFPSKPLPKSPTLKRRLPDRSMGLPSKTGLKARKRICLKKQSNCSGVVKKLTIYNSTKLLLLGKHICSHC